jgi:hypothetical protein
LSNKKKNLSTASHRQRGWGFVRLFWSILRSIINVIRL